jgi:hypothetical protein
VDTLSVPFDQYQRYRITALVAEAAAASRQAEAGSGPLRALDVGGHFEDLEGKARRPIAEFLPAWQTWTLDLPANPLPGYIRGRGDRLPFADHQFDLVSSVDVLEHVPPGSRPELLNEALRTSRRLVLLAAPFDSPQVIRAEQLLADFVERTCGYVQGQLREHRECGLPGLDATRGYLETAGWSVEVFPYGNLWRWLFMMIDKHAVAALPGSRQVHRLLDTHYNRELFDRDRDLPVYRHFLVAARTQDDPVLSFVRERFVPGNVPVPASPPASESTATDEMLFRLASQHAAMQHLQAASEPLRRDGHIAQLAADQAELRRHLDVRAAQVAEYQAAIRRIEQSPTFRTARLLRRLLGREG